MKKPKTIVRQLTKDDLPEIKSLLERRYTQLRKGKNQRGAKIVEDQLSRYEERYMEFEWTENGLPNEANNGRSYGVFHEGELRACLTQVFSSSRIPSFNIANLVIDPAVNTLYEVADAGVAQALDMAVEDAERHGYTQFYWITALKGWNQREQIWYNASRTYKRYNVFIENIVPHGERPKFSYEWNLLGYTTHTIDIAIKCAKIKPHLRHELFKSRGLLKVDYVPLQEDTQVPDLEENTLVIDSKGIRRWQNGSWNILEGDYATISTTEKEHKEPITEMQQADDWVEYTCRSISYEEILEYESYFLEQLLPLTNDYYDNIEQLRSAEWHFWCAEYEGKPVAFTGLGLQPNINRIYHRSSLTLPDHKLRGAWTAVWNHKLNEIIRNKWSTPETVHYVLTKPEDTRYTSRGFEAYQQRTVQFQEAEYEQTVWYTTWGKLLEHPKQKPFVNV